MGNLLSRLFAALPDAITSALFFSAWIAPSVLGPAWVKNLMLTMLIEFVVMHSSAFYAALSSDSSRSPMKRSLALIGLTAFYLIFIAGFSFAFESTWPFFAFGWLFVSRFIGLWTRPKNATQASALMASSWAASAMFYLGGVFATVIIPLPTFGLTPDFVASMHLSGSGLWIEHPQTVIVFGALYFGAQAWFKYYVAAKASTAQAAATARDG